MQKSEKKAQEAMALAAEESVKSKAAKEVIKSLTAQVEDPFKLSCIFNAYSVHKVACKYSKHQQNLSLLGDLIRAQNTWKKMYIT